MHQPGKEYAMKTKHIKCILVLLLVVFIVYSWFHVRGSEIDGVQEISDSCTVTVRAYQHLEYENRTEYTLNSEQIQELKNLILDSSFTRVLASYVTFEDQNMYDILIDFNNGQDFISIHNIGSEYIAVTNQFGDKHLKINNPEWKSTLERIIS